MAEKIKKPRLPKKFHVPRKDREYFTENLALLLKSAVPIGEALESLTAGIQNKQFKKALAAMNDDIQAGYNLADALERSGIATSQTLALVRLGEASGNLVENLQLAAQQEEKHHIFVSKVRSALIYPIVVISLTIVVGLGVAWFLLPRLAGTFSQMHVTLPFISQVLINFGIFLQDNGLVAVPAFVIAMALIGYVFFGAPKTKNIGKRLLLHLPGIGRLIREIEIAQYGYLLGTLMNAGLSVTEALWLLASTSTSPAYQTFYTYLAGAVDDGYMFKESLAKYKNSNKLLPPAVQQMIIAGERSGSLPTVLLTIGRTYEEKSDVTTENLETIIEPILLIFVASGVMLVAIAVILPIYSLVGGLNQ